MLCKHCAETAKISACYQYWFSHKARAQHCTGCYEENWLHPSQIKYAKYLQMQMRGQILGPYLQQRRCENMSVPDLPNRRWAVLSDPVDSWKTKNFYQFHEATSLDWPCWGFWKFVVKTIGLVPLFIHCGMESCECWSYLQNTQGEQGFLQFSQTKE